MRQDANAKKIACKVGWNIRNHKSLQCGAFVPRQTQASLLERFLLLGKFKNRKASF